MSKLTIFILCAIGVSAIVTLLGWLLAYQPKMFFAWGVSVLLILSFFKGAS